MNLKKRTMPKNSIYDPIKNKSLEKNRCFLCGIKLTKTNRTEEHIFPRWLLNRYDLWNNTLVLLNRKSIQYRKIKIPSCKKCNSVHLGKLEKTIEQASRKGYREFIRVPKVRIFQWLQKIYYQILYMELRLLFNPAKKTEGTIIDKETLKRYRMCHLFLQSIRIKVKFHKPYPWSIFIFKVQEYKENKLNFDFKDNLFFLTIAIRLGDIGIIGCLQDNNAQEMMFKDYFRKIRRITLHPFQFDEIIAKVFYKESLRNRTPKYIYMLGKDQLEVVSMPLGELSSKPIYDDWNQAEYAKFVSVFCGLDHSLVYQPPDKVWSILYNEKGKLRKLDIKTCGF